MTQETPTPIPFEVFRARLGPILDAVARERRAVLVERSGTVFRLTPQDAGLEHERAHPHDLWAAYDPVRVRAALEQAAGALAGVDRDELLRDLMEQREQDSPARPAGG